MTLFSTDKPRSSNVRKSRETPKKYLDANCAQYSCARPVLPRGVLCAGNPHHSARRLLSIRPDGRRKLTKFPQLGNIMITRVSSAFFRSVIQERVCLCQSPGSQ